MSLIFTTILSGLTLRIFKTLIAKEQPCEDARLRVGSLIEPCAIVPGAEKILNLCNIEYCKATMT